jgi:hypothetical protein
MNLPTNIKTNPDSDRQNNSEFPNLNVGQDLRFQLRRLGCCRETQHLGGLLGYAKPQPNLRFSLTPSVLFYKDITS